MSDGLLPGIENNEALIGLGLFALALMISPVANRFSQFSLKEELNDAASRPLIIKRFRAKGPKAYLAAIDKVIEFATQVYGERLVSPQSVVRSLQLAYVYPFVSLSIGWLLFDTTTVGEVNLMQSVPNLAHRGLLFLMIVLGWTLAVVFAFKIGRQRRFLAGKRSELSNETWYRRLAISAAEIGTMFFVAAFAVVLIVGAGAFSIPASNGITLTIAFTAAALISSRRKPDMIALAVVLSPAAFASALTSLPSVWTTTFLFFIILPVLNAAADNVSVAATRFFLWHLSDRTPRLLLFFGHLALDFVIAALCLAGLVASFIGVLELWAQVSPDSLLFDWRAYWADIQADPRQGTMLYIMVFTTLIPTLIHVVAGLGAVVVQRGHWLRGVADELEAAEGGLSLTKVNELTRRIRNAQFFGSAVALAIVITVGFALWHLGLWVWQLL